MTLRVQPGPVTTLTLDRPAVRNALDLVTLDAIDAALDAAADARVIVITGAGESVFCSGADLAGVAADPVGRVDASRRYARVLHRLATFDAPVVARVNGHCLAGGMGLLLACDLAIATDDATFFLPESQVGMWPMMVGAFLLRELPRKLAMDLALTGRKLSAAEAVSLGLLNAAVPRADLDAAIADMTGKILARSPTAARLGRRAWRDAAAMPLDAGLDSLAEALGALMGTEDAAEGFAAFLQKRPPNWTNR
jgi:enoyl-CoA hydratase/carnithine racemase